MIAFCVSSNDARPDTIEHAADVRGSRRACSAQPTTLSTALCRPTSSRTTSSSPSAVKRPGGVQAARRVERPLLLAQRVGQPAMT